MKMVGNKKTETNVYKAYDDCKLDVRSKRQVRGVSLSLFRSIRKKEHGLKLSYLAGIQS